MSDVLLHGHRIAVNESEKTLTIEHFSLIHVEKAKQQKIKF
jgi:hypothetical protein